MSKLDTEVMENSQRYLADRLDAPTGNVLYANIRHVSASGMTRKISFYLVSGGELIDVTYHVANAVGYKVQNHHGFNVINVQGVGMDMAFKVTYDLSATLFNGNGYHVSSRII